MRRSTTKTISIIFMVLFICTSLFVFTSCNKQTETNNERDLYIVDTSFNEDEGYMMVTLGFAGTEDRKLNLSQKVSYLGASQKDGSYYTISNYSYSLNGVAIYSAVDNLLTQDEKFYNGTLYSSLKLQLQYATIYKSIKSEGVITKQGRYYIHTFEIDPLLEEQDVKLSIRQANSAAWYGTLVGSAVGLMVIIGGVLVWRKKHGQSNQERIIN